MKTIRILQNVLFNVFAAAALAACSPVQFSAKDGQPLTPSDPAGIDDPSCTPRSVGEIQRLTKLLFVVDASGSNAGTTAWMGAFIPPTDPYKQFRYGSLSNFLARYRHKTNFQWSLITFSSDQARAYIHWGSPFSPAFAPAHTMETALNTFLYERDEGNTPYGAALELARLAIQNDPDQSSSDNPQYFVIFISDGFPTDYFDSWDRFDQTSLERHIDTLLNAAPQQVRLSTIFYGQTVIPQAVELLRYMANRGGGQFATVQNLPSHFQIEDVIPRQTLPCP